MTATARPANHRSRWGVAALACLLVATASCSSGGSSGSSDAPKRDTVLQQIASQTIVPTYDDLVTLIERLDQAAVRLCSAPAQAALDETRQAWKQAVTAWSRVRSAILVTAEDRGLSSAVGYAARPKAIADLLDSDKALDPQTLRDQPSTTRGIYAAEIALFGVGSEALASAGSDRRCTYLTSLTDLMDRDVTEVRDAWKASFAKTFARGIDGDQQMSVQLLLRSVTLRIQEVDEKGLRDQVAASELDDLPDTRLDGPAGWSMAERKALLDGAVDLIGDGTGAGVAALVDARSSDTAKRLVAAGDRARTAVDALPDSVADAFTDKAKLQAASKAVAKLAVLLRTEVASQLGTTIGFSDSDGDS